MKLVRSFTRVWVRPLYVLIAWISPEIAVISSEARLAIGVTVHRDDVKISNQ